MIRHCVFVRFAPETAPETRTLLFDDIAALAERMPGLLAAYVGPNVSPEQGMDKGFSAGFILDFDGADARDAYLSDAEHQRIGARIVAAADGGVDGVLVYDLDAEDSPRVSGPRGSQSRLTESNRGPSHYE